MSRGLARRLWILKELLPLPRAQSVQVLKRPLSASVVEKPLIQQTLLMKSFACCVNPYRSEEKELDIFKFVPHVVIDGIDWLALAIYHSP